MEQQFARQLKKGALEMLVLALLDRRASHGYELLLRLKESSGGQLVLKEGTLYPILYRLEDDGCIVSAWQSPTGEPQTPKTARKVYRITEQGRALLAEQREVWQQFSGSVKQVLEGNA